MRTGHATGLQIAFLIFAVMLIAVPVSQVVIKTMELGGAAKVLAEKGTHFALAILVIATFPRLRTFARQSLSTPLPRAMRAEVAAVSLAKLSIAFATAGGLALMAWWNLGLEGMARISSNAEREAAKAFSPVGVVGLFMASLVGPIVEEVVFRGFIYRAFERQWGWIAGMLATSALFGLYHAHFWSAFAGSVVLVCVLRRTGALWAPILVHMLFNFMLWWPLLGQYVFPSRNVTDPSTWYFHFACLAFVLVALPVYVWMSRDRNVAAPTVFLGSDAAIQK